MQQHFPHIMHALLRSTLACTFHPGANHKQGGGDGGGGTKTASTPPPASAWAFRLTPPPVSCCQVLLLPAVDRLLPHPPTFLAVFWLTPSPFGERFGLDVLPSLS